MQWMWFTSAYKLKHVNFVHGRCVAKLGRRRTKHLSEVARKGTDWGCSLLGRISVTKGRQDLTTVARAGVGTWGGVP